MRDQHGKQPPMHPFVRASNPERTCPQAIRAEPLDRLVAPTPPAMMHKLERIVGEPQTAEMIQQPFRLLRIGGVPIPFSTHPASPL